jgi:hypothetical protein
VIYSEGFEGKVPAWSMTSEQATTPVQPGWQSVVDNMAVEGSNSLHCGYISGSHTANLPAISLTAGDYVLKFSRRLDVDNNDCSKGTLTVQRDGKVLGKPVCKSTKAMEQQSLAFSVTKASEQVKLSITFETKAAIADIKRGTWIDELVIVATPKAPACNCGAPP